MKNNKTKYVLIVLILIVLVIYVVHNKTELFSNPIINLPNNDVHFISDNNPNSISVPVFNYKLMITNNNITQTPEPANTLSTEMFVNTNTTTNMTSDNNKQDNIQKNIKLLLPENKTLKYLSVFQHKPFSNYKGIGQTLILTDKPFNNINNAIKSVIDRKCLNYLTSSPFKPLGYNLVWTSDLNTDGKIFSIWSPINPVGCTSLGDVIIMGTEAPSIEQVACYPITLLEKTELSNGIIWTAINDMGRLCYCWGAGNIDTFHATNIYSSDMNELQHVYNLSTTTLTNNIIGSNKLKNDKNNNNTVINKGITI